MTTVPKYLPAFCAYTNERGLAKPFSWGLWTYATNGKILIRIPRIESIDENLIWGQKCSEIEMRSDGVGYSIPILPARELEKCPESLGNGKCKKDCPECGGLGSVEAPKRVRIGGADFSSYYLRKMKMFLRDVRTNSPLPLAQLQFTFVGGHGVLAAMNPEK